MPEERSLQKTPIQPARAQSEEHLSPGEFVIEMVKVFLLAAVIIIPIRTFLFQPFFVQGSSMEPNFENGEYLIVNEFGYKQTDIGVGQSTWFSMHPSKLLVRQEPVVFHSPVKMGQYLIKRVIGLPGESVEIRQSKIILYNAVHPEGMVLDESGYLSHTVYTTDMPKLTLGTDEYFVLGDNRTASYDSRMFGPVKKHLIVGEVLLRAWPFARAEVY